MPVATVIGRSNLAWTSMVPYEAPGGNTELIADPSAKSSNDVVNPP
jgi:hypothetical protein